MTALTNRLALRGRITRDGLIVVLLAGLYAAAATAVTLDVAGPYELRAPLQFAPVALVAALLLRRTATSGPAALGAGLAATVGIALAVAPLMEEQPSVALAVPALLVSAWTTWRAPALAFVLVFAMTGFYGSLTALTPVRSGPMVDLVLGGLWVGLVITLVTGRREWRAVLWPGLAMSLAYLIFTLGMALTSEDVKLALESFRSSAWYMLAALLLALGGWRADSLEWMARGFVLVAVGVGAYAMLRYVIGPAGAEVEQALATNALYNTVDGELRLFGSLPSGHELGAWTATSTPFCAAIALGTPGRWRLLAALAAGLCMFAVVESSVRTALVAAVAGVLVVVALQGAARAFGATRIAITAAALVIVLAGAGAFAYTQLTPGSDRADRFANVLTPSRDASVQDRYYKWSNAIADVEDKPLGNGLATAGRLQFTKGPYQTIASDNVDSSYLKVAYEQGFLVMAAFILAVALLLLGLARRAVMTMDSRHASYAIGAAGALTSFSVLMLAALYVEGLTALCAWMLVGLGAAPFSAQDASAAPAPGPAPEPSP